MKPGINEKEVQQHFINTGCSMKELSQRFSISIGRAYRLTEKAILVVKDQQRIERLLGEIELAEIENELH